MGSARHVKGCRLTQETRVQYASDDVASTIHQSLPVLAPHPGQALGHVVAAQVELESNV